MEARFLVDQATSDPETRLVVFTPLDAPTEFASRFFSTAGTASATIQLPATGGRVNVFDLSTFAPTGFTEGSIQVTNPGASPIGVMFSLAFWSVVGAEQTILALGRRRVREQCANVR